MQSVMPDPSDEDEYSGHLQIRADYPVYRDWFEFAQWYYSYEHALSDMLQVYVENPHLFSRPPTTLPNTEDESTQTASWG